MSNEKNKIEALLFASAKRMGIDEISKITNIDDLGLIKAALDELKTDYETRGTSIVLTQDGDFWKLTVKDHYLPIMQKVVDKTELDRPLIETLAVIAWKYPVLQADVIKIRHNKAYDHMKRLEDLDFIKRIKFGRTNKITLTDRFFQYFDLPSKEQAKEVFKNIVPKTIKEKIEKSEVEIEHAEKKAEEIKKKIEDMEKQRKKEKKDDNNKGKRPKPDPNKPPVPNTTIGSDKEEKESEENIKETIEDLQKKEDKEIEQIEDDIKEIEKEEDKDVYSEMP